MTLRALPTETDLDTRARLTAEGWTIGRTFAYDEEGVPAVIWFTPAGDEACWELDDWEAPGWMPEIP